MPTIEEHAGDFEAELKSLLNRHSNENVSNTSDYILARYVVRCLEAFDYAVAQRESWYGRGSKPVSPEKKPQSPTQ